MLILLLESGVRKLQSRSGRYGLEWLEEMLSGLLTTFISSWLLLFCVLFSFVFFRFDSFFLNPSEWKKLEIRTFKREGWREDLRSLRYDPMMPRRIDL